MTVARLCRVLLLSRGVPLSRDLDLETSALKELCTLAAKLSNFSVIDLYCSILGRKKFRHVNTFCRIGITNKAKVFTQVFTKVFSLTTAQDT